MPANLSSLELKVRIEEKMFKKDKLGLFRTMAKFFFRFRSTAEYI